MSINRNRLDQLDSLLANFRPVEALFRLMEAAGAEEDNELLHGCAEMGQALATRFREVLKQEFGDGQGREV